MPDSHLPLPGSGAFRSDSAAYQASVFKHCEREGMEFAVGADLDSAVLAAIVTPLGTKIGVVMA